MSEDDNEDGPTMEYGINFDVSISKANGEKIVVNCVASRRLIVRRYVVGNIRLLSGRPRFGEGLLRFLTVLNGMSQCCNMTSVVSCIIATKSEPSPSPS